MMKICVRKCLARQGMGVLFLGFAIAVLCLLAPSGPVTDGICAEAKEPLAATEFKILEGRWVRPDGGYILELWDIKKDGRLKAAYFNPKPIKVFRSQLSRKEGKITILVELRDVNYPGSKYNLTYEPAANRLRGTYFQAVEKQIFNIEFVRVK